MFLSFVKYVGTTADCFGKDVNDSIAKGLGVAVRGHKNELETENWLYSLMIHCP